MSDEKKVELKPETQSAVLQILAAIDEKLASIYDKKEKAAAIGAVIEAAGKKQKEGEEAPPAAEAPAKK